jgi:alkylhydroperoxidase family enzyme
MSSIRTISEEEASPELAVTYEEIEEAFGMVPAIFRSMSLRPDLLRPLALFVRRLMIEEHALSRATKELLAAYVSRQNACAY